MDLAQKDHLKAYGIAYWILTQDINVEWLLNYRGGSFMLDGFPAITKEARIRGVTVESIDDQSVIGIYAEVDANNMEVVLLEKAPKIAIYTPPSKQPWDDAVTLALTYAEVDYEMLWDDEVFLGKLDRFDWLHLHHEDFTGQYGKFYRNFHNAPWYVDQQQEFETMAKRLGFTSVSEEKKLWRGLFGITLAKAVSFLPCALPPTPTILPWQRRV